jgi:hypothetical protein
MVLLFTVVFHCLASSMPVVRMHVATKLYQKFTFPAAIHCSQFPKIFTFIQAFFMAYSFQYLFLLVAILLLFFHLFLHTIPPNVKLPSGFPYAVELQNVSYLRQRAR